MEWSPNEVFLDEILPSKSYAEEKVRNAFNISKEPQWLREKYGRTTYGQGCL